MSHVCALWGHVFTLYVLRCTCLLPAGLAGLLLALGSLAQRSLAPIVGLRELNPYVASAVKDWRSRQGLAAALPRQLRPMPAAPGPAGQLAGTSSFGMSGVNAHLLLGPEVVGAPMAVDAVAGAVLPWQRQRHWPAPAPLALLLHCSALLSGGKGTAPQVAFSCSLKLARLALLRDHVTGGIPTLPTTCLIELVLAAAAALNSSNDGQGLQPSLASLAVGAPKLLAAGVDMLCTLQLGSGKAGVTSSGGGRHLAASLAGARQTAAVAEHSSGASAPHQLVQMLGLRLLDMQQASPQSVLGRLDSGSADSGCGWLLHPAAADATLVHLAATGGTSALSIASANAILPAADLAASSSKAWCCSLGLALPGSLALHSARAQPTCSSSNFAVSGLHLQPFAPGQQAGTTVASADASGADSLSYQIQWQAAEVLHENTPSSSSTSCSQVSVFGSGLRLSLATAGAAGATCGLAASLATANRISLKPAQGSTIGSTAVAAGGIEMLQRALATGGSATTVQVEGCFAAASLAASPRDCSSSSAMLAALMKVAAVEQPDRRWAAVLGDSQRPAGRGSSSAAAELAADQHGLQLGAGLVILPLMLRHAVPAQQAGSHHGDSSGLLGAASTGRWVISGGTGALGALSASWLTAAGARRVQLLGRTGRASSASLAAEGSEPAVVTLLMCDAAAAADAGAVLGGAAPLAGVLHAGGVLADATLPIQTLSGGFTRNEVCARPACGQHPDSWFGVRHMYAMGTSKVFHTARVKPTVVLLLALPTCRCALRVCAKARRRRQPCRRCSPAAAAARH